MINGFFKVIDLVLFTFGKSHIAIFRIHSYDTALPVSFFCGRFVGFAHTVASKQKYDAK